MTKGRKVATVVIGLALLAVPVSLLATDASINGGVLPGTWRFVVQDADGAPVPAAELHVVDADRDGEPLPMGNYKGPGSIVAGADGTLVLQLRQGYRISGSDARVLWIWPIRRIPNPRMRITAPGYESQDIRFGRPPEDARVVHLAKQP